MITEIILLAAFFGLGVVSRFWYIGLLALEKKLKNRPASITLEFFSMGIFVLCAVLLLFFVNEGAFAPFTIVASAIGFGAASLIV